MYDFKIIILLAQPSVAKAPRAKSVGRDKNDVETSKSLNAPKKPVPPPKSKEVIARAKPHHVPTKDNLRKVMHHTIHTIRKLFFQFCSYKYTRCLFSLNFRMSGLALLISQKQI